MRTDSTAVVLIFLFIVVMTTFVTLATVVSGIALEPYRDVAAILQAVATAAAIALGAMFAYRNSLFFRTFEPHLNISHSISHRNIGASYVHIAVVATLHNSSRVKIEINHGFFQLFQISPIDDDGVEILYAEVIPNNETGDVPAIQWPLLSEVYCVSDEDTLVIEPGQSHLETVEFIVPREVESVLLFSYFYNSQASGSPESALGWSATTPYDMVAGD